MAHVTFAHVGKTFTSKHGGDYPACSDLCFHIEEGERFGIIGESGAGKSTVAQLLVGRYEPTAGTIYYRDERMDMWRRREKRRAYCKIQLISQFPQAACNPRRTIAQTLCEPRENFTVLTKAERTQLVRAGLEAVGLSEDLATRYPHELSGGQCQRVVIARALVLEPELLICDEATSALDVSVQAGIGRMLRRLQAERGMTMLWIGHDIAFLQEQCERLLVMRQGRVETVVYPNRLGQSKNVYTQQLLKASQFQI